MEWLITKFFRTHTAQAGQALIELMIAIGLTSILLPALLTGMVASREGKAQENLRIGATALMKEGVEAVRSVREAGWGNVASNGTYHPVEASGVWSLVSGEESIGQFRRQIVISNTERDLNGDITVSGGEIDPSTKKVEVAVWWDTPIPSSVSSTIYLHRYLQNASQTHTSQADFDPGIKTNTIVTSTGEVQLEQGSGSGLDYGNKFIVTSAANLVAMTNSRVKVSFRFTAQNSKAVTAVKVYVNVEKGTSPVYTYGLQADSSGNPSGTYLGSGNFASTSAGWINVPISSVSLTAGNVYHLVVQYSSGTINNSNSIILRRTAPLNGLDPLTSDPDTNVNILVNTGSSWEVQNLQPLYQLEFDDGTYEGNVYFDPAEYVVNGGSYRGEKFTVTGDMVVTAFNILATKNSSNNPADSLYVVLEDVDSGATIEEGVIATPSQVTTAYANFTYSFTTPKTLQPGKTYRVYVKSPQSASSRAYKVLRPSTTDLSYFNAVTYDGENSVASFSTNSGGSWTDVLQSDIGGAYFTTQGGSGYFISGEFESSAIDAGSAVAFNRIGWTAITPGGTDLKLQAAINSDNATWNYFGPDGTITSYFTTPSAIPLSKVSGRYLRYKAFFTSDGTATPTLNDVSINYSP